MSFDPKCYDLATMFLSDEPEIDTDGNRNFLAQRIQNEIECTIQEIRNAEITQ